MSQLLESDERDSLASAHAPVGIELGKVESVAVAPHPPIARYYTLEEEKQSFVRRVFADAAGEYDRLEAMMALGSGRWYRRKALLRSGLRGGMKVLDVAAGTGLLAREAARIVGKSGRVIGVDPSPQMLAQAAGSLEIPLIVGRAEELPVAGGAFDFLSMGFALRHVPDLAGIFREYRRVLRPGGTICILELSRPPGWVPQALLNLYLRRLVPGVSRVARAVRQSARRDDGLDEAPFAGDRSSGDSAARLLWEYFGDTIAQCVKAERVVQVMRDAGLLNVNRHVELGIFSEYTARVPG